MKRVMMFSMAFLIPTLSHAEITREADSVEEVAQVFISEKCLTSGEVLESRKVEEFPGGEMHFVNLSGGWAFVVVDKSTPGFEYSIYDYACAATHE